MVEAVHPSVGFAPRAVERGEQVHPVLRWAFYLFIFSLTFEGTDFGPVELPNIAGALLLLAVLFQPRLFLRVPPPAFWCFGAYLYLCVILAACSGYADAVLPRLFVNFQLLVFCWIAYNLLRYEPVAQGLLAALIASCALASVMQLLGYPPPYKADRHRLIRLTFGLDPNQLAGSMALAALSLLGITWGNDRSKFWSRARALPLFFVLGATIVGTASRGGFLALAVGLSTFALRAGSFGKRLRNFLVVLLGMLLFAGIASQSELVRERMTSALERGDMTLRERTYPEAVGMILERPLVGWGPVTNTYELGARVNHPAYPHLDTHNLVLYVFTATGLLGAIPFFLGTALCIRAAWRARGGPRGILPFAMTATILVADMSVSGLDWKQHWLVMAYALASGSIALGAASRTPVGDSEAAALPVPALEPSRGSL